MEFLFVFALGVAWIAAPVVALIQIRQLHRELRRVRERLDALERESAWRAGPSVVPPAEAAPVPAVTVPFARPEPGSAAPPPEISPPPLELAPVAAFEGAPPAALSPTPPPPAPEPGAPAKTRDSGVRLEELVGSVWLQNAGAVLVLLGLFFLIVWGYTTGRLGPGVLLGSGVVLGLTFMWRGDRLAHSLPKLGHTLIGVGFGIVYLSLYLGHFTLRVLPLPIALWLLALTSLGAVTAGLRYRVQAIAALGLVGAFLPQLLAGWMPMRGFSLPPAALLAYFAVVDALVFALAARSGWSGLDLAALLLTALAWLGAYPRGDWGWGVTSGLVALFIGLGLAPLPRLVRVEGRVRPVDLAVIAAAPAALVLVLWRWFADLADRPAAMLLFALAGIQFVAAWWVDVRRPERDLWRPLTGAGTVFLTAALGRIAGTENLSLVWCVEGVALVALGIAPRGGWLRLCGYAVTALAATWTLTKLSEGGAAGELPFFGPHAVRDAVVIAALGAGAVLLARGRERLTAAERFMPELWTGVANLLLVVWSFRECDRVAYALEDSRGRWWRGVSLPAPPHGQRRYQLFAALVSCATFAQAAALAWLGVSRSRGFLRAGGYAVGALAVVATLAGLTLTDGWSSDQRPVFYLSGSLGLASLALALAVASHLALHRARLAFHERYAPEVWTTALTVLLLVFTAREADHVARAIEGLPGRHGHVIGVFDPARLTRVQTMASALTSGAWLVHAVTLLALGWFRRAPFLRWSALALFGLTLLKFAFWDLRNADAFWRFLTAIAAGAAMLGVSYAYQRRAKRAAEEATSAAASGGTTAGARAESGSPPPGGGSS